MYMRSVNKNKIYSDDNNFDKSDGYKVKSVGVV